MKEEGYDLPFSCAIMASTAVIGPIFPPSIPFGIYAMISGASVGRLFMDGMLPAIILCIDPEAGHAKVEDMVVITESGCELLAPDDGGWYVSAQAR